MVTETSHTVPPFDLTEGILALVAEICEALGRLSVDLPAEGGVSLRRVARIRSTPFITFMLRAIRDALAELTPQVPPQVMRLLTVCRGELRREELQERIGLADRKHFRTAYLRPALDAGHLPRFDADNLIQHVTFHLADSLSKSALHQLELSGESCTGHRWTGRRSRSGP